MNQRRLAETSGIRYHRYMEIENQYGKAPTDDEQRALAKTLCCRVKDIFPRSSVDVAVTAESSSAA